MANTVSSYRTLFGCDYHHLTSFTLQDTRAVKPVKDMVTLVMDDGQFAEYVKTNYDIDAEPTKTADQELKEDLGNWEYNEEERFILKANPKEFVSGYCNVKTKEAVAGRTGATGDSKNDEEEDNSLNEEHMSVAKTPQNSDDRELKPASSDDGDLKPAASNDGGLKQAASNDGDLAGATCTPEKDGPPVENNLAAKRLFPIDPASLSNTTSPTNIVCKLMSVDDRWNDKRVINCQIKSEWRRALPYKCLYPCLYCKGCDAIATSVHMTTNALRPIQRTRGGMTLNSSTSFPGWCVMLGICCIQP
jgi:hypothetical protein